MKTLILTKPSEYFRSTVARGIATKDEPAIDKSGGKFKAGLIRQFAVISRGEALGHGLWIDAEMLSQVSTAINAASGGVKARFTHPSLSGDGMGKMTSRVFAGSVDGDRVLADAHFLESAHDAPDGDLAGYVLDLAEEDPAAFGASISFRRDITAEEEFMKKHGAKKSVDEEGYSTWDLSEFKSPDPKNVNNYPHARLKSLRAVDFVDSPAANPDGLFHAGPFDLLENGEAMLDYVFGVTADIPDDVNFGVDSSRLKGFAARWAANRGFSIRKDVDMSTAAPAAPTAPVIETTKPAELTSSPVTASATPPAAAPPAQPAASPVTEASAASDGAKPPIPTEEVLRTQIPNAEFRNPNEKALSDAKTAGKSEAKAELAKFTELFGAEKGAKWFCEGKSIDECKDLHIADLNAAIKDREGKLVAATTGIGEDAPLSGSANAPSTKDSEFTQLARRLGSESLARACLAQKMPSPSTN